MSESSAVDMREQLTFGDIGAGRAAVRSAGFTPDQLHLSQKARADLYDIKSTDYMSNWPDTVSKIFELTVVTRPDYGPARAAVVRDSENYYYEGAEADVYNL